LEDLIFCEGEPDISFTPAFEETLFNLRNHRMLQSNTGWISFYALNGKEKKIYCCIHFNVGDAVAHSPLRAPFGSVEFAPSLPPEKLFAFLQYAEAALKAKNITRIIIKAPPENHSEYLPIVHTFFVNLGYRIINSEIAVGIRIADQSLDGHLHRSERRRLEKARNAGLQFMQLPVKELQRVYNFIATCRHEKKFDLSMPFERLQESAAAFPERYILFALYKQDVLTAASICIRVNENILYDFYHDHSAEYDHLSPVVMLVAGIYAWCHEQNIGLLDLGTSATGNTPNFSLLKFKLLLGGKPANKFTFQKDLS